MVGHPSSRLALTLIHCRKPATGRREVDQRAFADSLEVGPIAAHHAGTTELPSFGKQPSGLNYIKAKLTGKSKKNKDSESSSSSSTKPEPSEYLAIAPDATSMPN